MTLVLRYSARSDRGLVRQNNQDAVYAGPRLLALADGMGGHAAGEVASSLVISALAPLDEDDPSDDLLAELRQATFEGNAAITRHVALNSDLEGMGTTLTAILFKGNRLGLVHVGDSRCYQLRDGEFAQITKDDTFVQSLIDEGRITEDEAHTHPQRSLLLRAITGADVEPSLTIREARAGDRYLLCSDGLSGPVSDETLADTLRTYRDPRECADRLIELALRGGGPDNITCIVADVVDVDFGDDTPIVGGSVGDGSDDGYVGADTAAARASATTLPRVLPKRVEAPPAPEPATRRIAVRAGAAVLIALVVLGVGGLLARGWVMQQYYVGVSNGAGGAESSQGGAAATGQVSAESGVRGGADAGRLEWVAIYQGVRGSVLGFPLQTRAEDTDIALTDLPEDLRSSVRTGIVSSNGLEGAREAVQRLRARMLPLCPTPQEESPPAAQDGLPTPVVPIPGGSTANGQNPQPGSTDTSTDTTPLQTAPLEPGTTCRPAR